MLALGAPNGPQSISLDIVHDVTDAFAPDPSYSGAAEAALEIVRNLGSVERRTLYHGELRRALHPLLLHPAIEVVCGRPACQRRRIAWWALLPAEATVAATQERSPPRSRRGGLSDLAQPRPRTNLGLWPWLELADSGKTTVTLVDNSTPGLPVRLCFTCRTCKTPYTLTNTRRLTDFLEAIKNEESTIVLNY